MVAGRAPVAALLLIFICGAAVQVGTKVAFKGCIADATINGRVLNLLEPFANSSAAFGRCGATVSTGGVPPDAGQWPMPTEDKDILPVATLPPPVEVTEATAAPETTTVRITNRAGVDQESRPPVQPQPQPQPPPPQPTAKPQQPQPPKRTPAQPEPGCALAYDPYYIVGDPDEGYRFGTRNDSRIEYARLPGRQHDGFDLTITLRTYDEHGGLIFYAHAESEPQQFLALYMKSGKLHLAFNCGAETMTVESPLSYKDAEWHTATLVRSGASGKLSVDNELVGETSGACRAPAALAPPFYYGGLRNYTADIKTNLQDFYQPFKGCLKGLMMNGQRVTETLFRVNALQCRDNVEAGLYFGPSKGSHTNYLKLKESFKVGFEISISIDIKPRNSTGLLLSVHGRKDFLVLELLDNEIVVNVENGKGPFHASFKLGNNFSICDGQWHKIHVAKSRHVVSVGVDGHFSDAGLGQSSSTDTRFGLYIGGHARPLESLQGVRSRRGYAGCIRNIVIKDMPVNIPTNAAHGNVHVGVCPVD